VNIRTTELVEVLRVVVLEGDGKSKESIVRTVTYYFSKDGELLAWNDPCPDGKMPERRE